MKNTLSLAATTALLAMATGPLAQETQPAVPDPTMPQDVAQQCLDDLAALGQRMDEDGYWLVGVRDRWGTAGWGDLATGTGPAYYPGVGLPPEGMAGDPTTTGTAAAPDPTVAQPAWGLGIRAPGVQIETLFRAAQILAIRGDQEGCDMVLAELRTLYEDYATRLEEAGVDPGQVATWRRDMLLTAQPVSEVDLGRLSIDQITGSEVRNLQDERLGDIDDVLVSDGRVEHVVIARGGFFGIGADYVAVPWERLSATPGMNMFLLDVSAQVLEEAPHVSGDVLRLTDAERAEIESFWQEAGGG